MSEDTDYGLEIALDCAQQEAFQLLDKVEELTAENKRLREDYRTLTLSFADVKAAELKEKIENKRLRELLRSSACPICDSDLVLENEFHCAYCEEVDKALEEV